MGLSKTILIILLVVIIILGGWYFYDQKQKGVPLLPWAARAPSSTKGGAPSSREPEREPKNKVRFNEKVRTRHYRKTTSDVDVDSLIRTGTDEMRSVSRYQASPRLQDLSEESTGSDSETEMNSEIVGADDDVTDEISIWEKAFEQPKDEKEARQKYAKKLHLRHLKHQKAESEFVKYQTDRSTIQSDDRHNLLKDPESCKGMTIGEIYDRQTSKSNPKSRREPRACGSDSQYSKADFSDDF